MIVINHYIQTFNNIGEYRQDMQQICAYCNKVLCETEDMLDVPIFCDKEHQLRYKAVKSDKI